MGVSTYSEYNGSNLESYGYLNGNLDLVIYWYWRYWIALKIGDYGGLWDLSEDSERNFMWTSCGPRYGHNESGIAFIVDFGWYF